MNIVLLGPPGAGKGTVASFLQTEFGFEKISTGDLLRKEILEGTDLGKTISPILSSGKLVDNAIVARVLTKAIKASKKGFILDGFPRNAEQVRILEKILAQTKEKIHLTLEFKVLDKFIIDRLSSRRQCPKCNTVYGQFAPPKKAGVCDKDGEKLFWREDDKPQVIKDRLAIYRKETIPLVAYFKKTSAVKELDASKSIREVNADVKQIIESMES